MDNDDRELYEYGFRLLFSHTMFFLLTVLCGVLLQIIPESILFYISFSLIRSYAGGIHAKTETACTVFTSLSIVASVVAIKLGAVYDPFMAAAVLMVVSATAILCIAPLDTQEKQLTSAERKRFRRITLLILICVVFLTIAACVCHLPSVFYVCAVSVNLEGVLLLAGSINQNLSKAIPFWKHR